LRGVISQFGEVVRIKSSQQPGNGFFRHQHEGRTTLTATHHAGAADAGMVTTDRHNLFNLTVADLVIQRGRLTALDHESTYRRPIRVDYRSLGTVDSICLSHHVPNAFGQPRLPCRFEGIHNLIKLPNLDCG
jgi:hypothetical protein